MQVVRHPLRLIRERGENRRSFVYVPALVTDGAVERAVITARVGCLTGSKLRLGLGFCMTGYNVKHCGHMLRDEPGNSTFGFLENTAAIKDYFRDKTLLRLGLGNLGAEAVDFPCRCVLSFGLRNPAVQKLRNKLQMRCCCCLWLAQFGSSFTGCGAAVRV